MFRFLRAQRLLRGPIALSFSIALGLSTAVMPDRAEAQSARNAVFIVQNDVGGLVGPRAKQIKRLKRSGKRVEIRGRVCLSSCTMFLGAGDVCVHPDTQFGFHGPSYYGRPLAPEHFQYWSEVLAEHYPAPIRTWFMAKARYKQQGFYTLTGRELIRQGVRAC